MKGRMDHEEKMEKRARGGGITQRVARANSDTAPEVLKPALKKRGGRVHGEKPGMRMDKKARGGRMTPSSPLSGADTTEMPYMKGKPGVDEGGKGRGRD